MDQKTPSVLEDTGSKLECRLGRWQEVDTTTRVIQSGGHSMAHAHFAHSGPSLRHALVSLIFGRRHDVPAAIGPFIHVAFGVLSTQRHTCIDID